MSAQPRPALPPLRGAELALLTFAVAFSTFMEVLDITIVNVSVPSIAGSLAVSPSEGTWAISSYSLASAIMQPLTGWIARQFGEVKSFCVSVTLFVLFSMLCGFATSMPMLVIFRLMQGAVSGPMVPLSQSLLLGNYPVEKKGMALALWAMTVVVAPIFGPIIGGYLTDNFSWPWIFYINVPVGLLAAFITWTMLRKRETPTIKQPIDTVGLILLVIGVGSLQFMLDNGNDKDWFSSQLITGLAITAAIGLTLFVAWELTDQHPVVDLSLFKRRNFRVGVIALSLGFMAFFGINVIFPLWLQTNLGYTATWAGLATAPVGILAFFFSPIVGRNINKFDLRVVSSIAFVIFGATAWWFSTFTTQASFGQLVLPRFIQGIAIACFFIPIQQIILSGLPPSQYASAGGLSNFFRTISASFSTAVTVTLWDHRADFHHATLSEHVTAFNAPTQSYIDTVQAASGNVATAYGAIERVLSQEAYTLATNDVFWLFALMFFGLVGVVWFAKPPFGSGSAAGGH